MKRTTLLAIHFLIFLSPLAHAELPGPYIGFIADTDSGPKYHLRFNFGIEQWEDGKRAEKMNERWILQCQYPDTYSKKGGTWCHLDRTTFWQLGDEVTATSQDHNFSNGTLELINVDWNVGVLDLRIVHKSHTNTEIKIRMIIRGKSIYLGSFEAFAITRGVFPPDTPMTVLEFRIPQYTYTLNVPIKMHGLRTEEDKKMEDMVASLSQQDQAAWANFKKDEVKNCKFLSERKIHTEDEILEKIIPNWGKRKTEIGAEGKLTADEENKIREYASGLFAECLATTTISPLGQQKILDAMFEK